MHQFQLYCEERKHRYLDIYIRTPRLHACLHNTAGHAESKTIAIYITETL